MTTAPGIVYRQARPEDAAAVEALDSSFTTDTVFEVTVSESGAGFALREVPVDPPLHKVFPPEEHDEQALGGAPADTAAHTRTYVALADGEVCGFVATGYDSWNRRLTIEDIEVAPGHRGRGIGRALMEHAAAFGRERGADHLWLEVSSVNAPAVHAYRRMGFALCGLDTTLYAGTPSAGEQALFMSRPCL
jgi:ribosomal protein S18 acetylase RimI-like enzyme